MLYLNINMFITRPIGNDKKAEAREGEKNDWLFFEINQKCATLTEMNVRRIELFTYTYMRSTWYSFGPGARRPGEKNRFLQLRQ